MGKAVIVTLFFLCSQVWANERVDDNKCKGKLASVVIALAVADGWDPKTTSSTGARLDFFGKMHSNGKLAFYSARFTYYSGYSNYSDYSLVVTEADCNIDSVKVNRL